MQRNEITSHHAPVFGHRRNATVRGRRLRYSCLGLGPDLPLLALLRVPANAPGAGALRQLILISQHITLKSVHLRP